MQFEQITYSFPTSLSQHFNSKISNIGKAVIKEYNSPHVLELCTLKQQSTQLEALTHCQKCLNCFKQPITLSCGFTLCYQCLPSTEPYQCLSFSCLRSHDNNYKPNVLLESILSQYNSRNPNSQEMLKSLLDCSICLAPLVEPITTQCGHTFCKGCLIRTMMDSNNRACPFCRHELARIGKVNQVISGWLDFLNNGMIYYPKNDQDQIVPSQHMPIIEVTSAVVFPTQHCLIHVTNDCRSLLKQMVNNPHRNHYAICVFGQGNESLHDYGVMLQINHVEYSPDVRHSVVQAVGLFRLGISQLTLDENNCYTGDVTRLDDSEFELPSKKYKAPDVITNNNTQDAPLERKLKRIRPCSMRLGSSISSNYQFSMSNNIPVCNYRKTWATSTQFSKPSSPHLLWTYTQPTYAVSPCSKHNITNKIPNPPPPHQKSATTTAIPTLANVDTLLAGDLHPRLVQYLSRMNNEAWLKQYEVYTQQFDRSTLIWWVSNALPLHQEEKLQLLAMQSLKERIMAIIYFMDKWR